MAYVNKTYNLGASSFGENIPGGSPPGVPLYRYTYTCPAVAATSASQMGTCRIPQYENSALSNNSWYHFVQISNNLDRNMSLQIIIIFCKGRFVSKLLGQTKCYRYTYTCSAVAATAASHYVCMYICIGMKVDHHLAGTFLMVTRRVCLQRGIHTGIHMGLLRLVGSLKLQVFFAKESHKRDDILQKRPIILRSLLCVATPDTYSAVTATSASAEYVYVYRPVVHIHILCCYYIHILCCYSREVYIHIFCCYCYFCIALQGGKDSQDAFVRRSLSAKGPLMIGLIGGKRPIKIRHPMPICHSVFVYVYIYNDQGS